MLLGEKKIKVETKSFSLSSDSDLNSERNHQNVVITFASKMMSSKGGFGGVNEKGSSDKAGASLCYLISFQNTLICLSTD